MAEKHALIPDPLAMYTQAETKDMSKNLMSGDFEKQYSDKVRKCGVGRSVLVAAAVGVGTLVACLVVLCLVREVHIAGLKHDLDDLSAELIAISANVRALNQKVNNNKHLFNDFKSAEDTIYADEDQDITSLSEGTKKKDKPRYEYDSLEKLHDLTVLEDDNLVDDEDLEMEAEDDAESGDWYPDYDSRAEKIGTTNMVHLKPEDFAESVVTMEKEGSMKQALLSNIRVIKRLLNENPENPELPPLVPTEANDSSKESRSKRSLFADSSPDAVDTFAAPKVVSKEERRKTKKYSANLEATSTSKMPAHTVPRTARNSDDARGRPFIAAHFHGNTSHLRPEIHEHYKGNGLVRVSYGAPHDVWYPAPWTLASPHPRPTLTRTGHVHVHHTGLYFIYVQIYYLDSHDMISWVLHRTNPEIEERETLLQCTLSSHSTHPEDRPNSCFSAAVFFLKAGDKLAVRNTGGERHSIMQSEKSFIGLVKLADAEDPTEEL